MELKFKPIAKCITNSSDQVSVNNMSTIGSVWCPRREALLQDPEPQLMTELSPDLEVGTTLAFFTLTADQPYTF